MRKPILGIPSTPSHLYKREVRWLIPLVLFGEMSQYLMHQIQVKALLVLEPHLIRTVITTSWVNTTLASKWMVNGSIKPQLVRMYFLLKFFANQTLDWGITGVSSANSWGAGVAIGPNGTIYITGTADGYVTFGGFTATSPDGMFVAKFSSSGQPLWAKTGGSGSSWCGGLDIVVDENGYAYVSGMNYLGGDYDAFVAKIDLNGNWAGYDASNDFGGGAVDSATGITMDEQGFIYVSMTNFSLTGKSVVTVMKFNKSNFVISNLVS